MTNIQANEREVRKEGLDTDRKVYLRGGPCGGGKVQVLLWGGGLFFQRLKKKEKRKRKESCQGQDRGKSLPCKEGGSALAWRAGPGGSGRGSGAPGATQVLGRAAL